jgi:hypothetical protein
MDKETVVKDRITKIENLERKLNRLAVWIASNIPVGLLIDGESSVDTAIRLIHNSRKHMIESGDHLNRLLHWMEEQGFKLKHGSTIADEAIRIMGDLKSKLEEISGEVEMSMDSPVKTFCYVEINEKHYGHIHSSDRTRQRHGPFTSARLAEEFAVSLVKHSGIAEMLVKDCNVEIVSMEKSNE